MIVTFSLWSSEQSGGDDFFHWLCGKSVVGKEAGIFFNSLEHKALWNADLLDSKK